ncbi:serine protease [Cerasicoccus fimbriatus]|uniref:serine protease n=1 Tax=Cerasicoccus fimbriatus TaxID=3014554 RepID=UPI0022B38EEA|nr:serine protease [Cerasicoccus sp. TK19100]
MISLPLAAQDTSGLDDIQIMPKIVGGKDATPGEYPWMVGIMERQNPDNYQAQFCGGVLIHPYYVLTAAHCMGGESTSSMNVLVGTDNLDFGGRRVNVSQIIIHPNYDDEELDYDIALLRLATPVTDIEPIGIADDEDWQVEGTLARIIGWGQYTMTPASWPTQLQEGDIEILNYEQANEAWFYTLTDRMMPALGNNGQVDTCVSDSGGPLLVQRPIDNEWVVAGITSFGYECGSVDPPAIYTRVWRLREYIYRYIYSDFEAYASGYDQYSLSSDVDGDSYDLLAEYGFNMDPDDGTLEGIPTSGTVLIDGEPYATIQFNRRRFMDDFAFTLYQAPTPTGPWEEIALGAQTISTTIVDATTESVQARAAAPIGEAAFLRLELEPTGAL